ncbi:MAG: cytochrome c family protein [Acidobacteria bacterium]|nr:cytochrome c family protein [Acidobacteriota bacterium]
MANNSWLSNRSILRELICGVSMLWLVSAGMGQQSPTYKGKEEKLPASVSSQPIAFSHKKHMGLGMRCLDCHVDAGEKDRAGLPQAEQCLACHSTIKADSPEVKKLVGVEKQGRKVQWVRVYLVPDFVFFSHANHLKAKLACAACHGPVEKRDVLAKEVSTSMVACMNCHAAKRVSNECSFCHQLGH